MTDSVSHVSPGNDLTVLEKENHECVMLEDGGCRIHPVKPSQSAGFPNKSNIPGWRDICEAIPVPVFPPDRGKNRPS